MLLDPDPMAYQRYRKRRNGAVFRRLHGPRPQTAKQRSPEDREYHRDWMRRYREAQTVYDPATFDPYFPLV